MLHLSCLRSAFRVPRFALSSVFCLLSSVLSPVLAQDDPFAEGVRKTPWLAPADEQKAFKLPPGFEIQLVAAEPDIQKPLNMAFDERGRIWLTCSVEYPYAAPLDKPGRDCIKVLEDTDGDGRFEKIHTFADGLNIPIGIYPYKGGCIAWSIPNIWHFEDTDSDGTCDNRTVLYGPFDHTRDTHGMVNSLRRGWDGWIYACHGFNNDSHVKGKDGHEVHLNSGNTFRFKLDGSRIEHFTHGQVNPFGMCFDELFNIFTADCHSKPLTQLIRGGHYPSFGKPHDGLGFVPSMMDHLHGSTAICGVAVCKSSNFPREFRGDLFSGNVMTSRINRNKAIHHGSTVKAQEQPDFLSTTDPWFRPVDLHFGPDGGLYVLDFYNRIIGHYEVPLPHPGRDRTSGRIWRIVYTVDEQETFPVEKPIDLTRLTVEELLERAPMTEEWLPEHFSILNKGPAAVPVLNEAWKNFSNSQNDNLRLLWLLESYGELTDAIMNEALEHESRWESRHVMWIIAERKEWNEFQRAAALRGLANNDPFVARAAADALGRHPKPTQIWPLLARLQSTHSADVVLRHTIRIALRDHVSALDSPETIDHLQLTAAERTTLADLCKAVPSATAAAILLKEMESKGATPETIEYAAHAARYADGPIARQLVSVCQARFKEDLQLQASLIQAIVKGLEQRRETPDAALSEWSSDVAHQLLQHSNGSSLGWTAVPVEGKPASESPWVSAARPCQDGKNDQPFYYSLPKGEQRTGVYRSAAFEIPAKLSFWCAGHSGFPAKPLNDGNWVRLRDATTHAVLAESRPPRNDVAQRIEWDLTKAATSGRGYIELVDGDTADAYAWLAVGRFSLAALNPSDTARKQQLAAEIVGKLKLAELRPQLATLVASPSTDGAARAAIGQALVSLDPDSRASALVASLNEPAIPADLRVAIGHTLTRRASEGVPEETTTLYLDNLREVMKRAPSRLQTLVAETLAGDAAGADALLVLVEAGHASPRLLLAANVSSKFGTLKNEALDKRVSAATAKQPQVSETLDKLILERRVAFPRATPSLERGLAVFSKHCAACHQIDGKGAVVGPQLDGIGGRGLERIIEDVLDPNRNVDVAFRTTTMRLTDGRVVSGLFRRAEGAQLVFADNLGKEFTVAKDEIDQETKTALSLMPANVPEIVPAEEFHDLVGYLLSQRAPPPK